MAHHLSDIYSNITVKLFTSNPTDAALHHTASVLRASYDWKRIQSKAKEWGLYVKVNERLLGWQKNFGSQCDIIITTAAGDKMVFWLELHSVVQCYEHWLLQLLAKGGVVCLSSIILLQMTKIINSIIFSID